MSIEPRRLGSGLGPEIALLVFSVGAGLSLLTAEGGAYAAVLLILMTTVPATLIAVYTAARPWMTAIPASGLAIAGAAGFLMTLDNAWALAIPLGGMLVGLPTSDARWVRAGSAMALIAPAAFVLIR